MAWGNENDYREWLEEIGEEDSPEVAGWFFCEEDQRAKYLEEHPDLFDHY